MRRAKGRKQAKLNLNTNDLNNMTITVVDANGTEIPFQALMPRYFVQKDESTIAALGYPLWFVENQFGTGWEKFPLGFRTRAAARKAIIEAGLVEGEHES